MAQLVAQREPIGTMASYSDAASSGWVGLDRGEGASVLHWHMLSGPRVGLIATKELPFDVPGDPCDLGGARIHVPGSDRAKGKASLVIVRLHVETSTIDVEQSAECGDGIDLAHVYWDQVDRLLYVHDFAVPRILSAPFDGTRLPATREACAREPPESDPRAIGYPDARSEVNPWTRMDGLDPWLWPSAGKDGAFGAVCCPLDGAVSYGAACASARPHP